MKIQRKWAADPGVFFLTSTAERCFLGCSFLVYKMDIWLQSAWKKISGKNSENYCGYELQSKEESWIICSMDSPLPTHLTVPKMATVSGKIGKIATLHQYFQLHMGWLMRTRGTGWLCSRTAGLCPSAWCHLSAGLIYLRHNRYQQFSDVGAW